MSTRRITTARALRAGTVLSQLLEEAHHDGGGVWYAPDPVAAVVAVMVEHLLDGQAPEATLIAAAETWHDANARAAAVREERQARHEQTRRRLRLIADTHPCPACQVAAGELCVTLSPARRPKPITDSGLHAARLRLGSAVDPEAVDTSRERLHAMSNPTHQEETRHDQDDADHQSGPDPAA